MKEYFKPTGKKILGIIILLCLSSFIGFFLQYIANPLTFTSIPVGLPLTFFSIGTTDFNILNLVIDIIIFYLIIVILAIIFRRRKVENVPNSDNGRRDTGTPNQAQP